MRLKYESNNADFQVRTSDSVKSSEQVLNLDRKRLKIASLTSRPFQDVIAINESCFVGKGFSFEIVDHLSEHFNFTYDVVVPADQDFGMLVNGSRWTGLVGMLLNKTADMAAAPISITPERQNAITFGTVLFEDSLGILFSRPQGKQNSGALAAPFSTTVWIVIIIIAFILCPILYLLVRLSRCIRRRRRKKRKRPRNSKTYLTFGDCVWFVYSGLMKQGFEKSSSSLPVRILMTAWWLTCILLAAFYTANLTAFLTLENSSAELTIRELAHSKKLWSFKKGTAFSHTLLQEKLTEHDREEFSLMRESVYNGYGVTVNSEREALQLAEKGYAYIQEVNVLNYLLFKDFLDKNGYCQFHVLNLELFKHSTAFAFPRESPYASHFSKYMEVLRKNGLVQKWMHQYLLTADVCAPHNDYKLSQKEQALELKDIYMAFYMLMIGMLAGAIICIVEFRKGRIRKYWRSKFIAYKKKWR